MRQLARIHVGNSKTDIRDAFVITHAGANLPDALRMVDRDQEVFSQLKVLNGLDEDLARSYTRLINQIRSLLMGTYPEFEHVLRGQAIHRKWILSLLAKYGGPTKISRVGRARLIAFAVEHNARKTEPIVDGLLENIKHQTVRIQGAQYAELGIAMAATDALTKLEHRARIRKEVEALIDTIPHTQILLSMPGIGVWAAGRILMTAELAELRHTPNKRRQDIVSFFDIGVSNGPVEAINGRLEHLHGIALGFGNLTSKLNALHNRKSLFVRVHLFTLPGDSGGLLYAPFEDGTAAVIGVLSGSPTFRGGDTHDFLADFALAVPVLADAGLEFVS